MRGIVIIPTLNEEGNIAALLRNILSLEENLDVLVVDDHSDDQTVACVQRIQSENSRVRLISSQRPHRSLASCYKSGFSHVFKEGYDWIIGMDGDFSHDPREISKLLNQRDDADWIVGSRYVRGGCSPGLSFARLMLSRLANFYIHKRLRTNIADVTSGFNCFKSSVLEGVDFLSIASKGFIFQMEIKYLAQKSGVRFKEVPISFNRRLSGVSKFSWRMVFEALRRIRVLEGKGVGDVLAR